MTRHTYVHVSALVRGPVGPAYFTTPDWTPPAATTTEAALVARLGGYRAHPYGGITLGEAVTREDLVLHESLTIVGIRGEGVQLEIAQELSGGTAATLREQDDARDTPGVITRLIMADAQRRGLSEALVVHGRAPQWKGLLQRALARAGLNTAFHVQTASLVTGYVNHAGLFACWSHGGDRRRTLIIDHADLPRVENPWRGPTIGAIQDLGHQVGATRAVMRVTEAREIPDARLLAEALPTGYHVEIAVTQHGDELVDALAAGSQYRRSLADDFVTVRGSDLAFWRDFDARAWMLGAPVERMYL